MSSQEIKFEIKELSVLEISDFFKAHDNDYFEKLSDRVNINEYSEKLLESSIQFTLWDNVNLIGLSPCYFNNVEEKVGYISSLTIKEGFRGRKLGSKLIARIGEYAKEHGFNVVMVKIHYLNEMSHQFYKKNGFTDFIADKENAFRLLRLEVE
ncbi:GNAT family N-acetyltransferase [uncultured Cocleimonas sp.]|uniref:GNAT family N-acetyltransferase n=1 Tax=uncultured Cocleimonas sp. TaxID=1051587 RepID=UPI0026361C79|nr:GNAT family N-acetyltransferase [uncultured Cocleimonas sp.]